MLDASSSPVLCVPDEEHLGRSLVPAVLAEAGAPLFRSAALEIGCPALVRGRYRRRESEKTLLHRMVRENLAAFSSKRRRLPQRRASFIQCAEFERYLGCGLLCHGFAQIRCERCGGRSLLLLKNYGLVFSYENKCEAKERADALKKYIQSNIVSSDKISNT